MIKYLSARRELFLSEVNNRETVATIEANNDTYYLQKRIEKFPRIAGWCCRVDGMLACRTDSQRSNLTEGYPEGKPVHAYIVHTPIYGKGRCSTRHDHRPTTHNQVRVGISGPTKWTLVQQNLKNE